MFIFSDDKMLAINSSYVQMFSFGPNSEDKSLWDVDALFESPVDKKPMRFRVCKQNSQQACIQWINTINSKLRKEGNGTSK